MSDDWVITPPSSPVLGGCQNEQPKIHHPARSKSEIVLQHDRPICLFNCMGEACIKNVSFHPESYFSCKDYLLFEEDYTTLVIYDDEDDTSFYLFGFKFDKGSALVQEMDTLFKMSRLSIMQLDSAAKVSIRSLGKPNIDKRNVDPKKLRQNVVEFLTYIRNYIQRVCYYEKYAWLMEKLFPDLLENLKCLRLILGKIEDIPDYIVNYSANHIGNKCNQPSYYMYHCQLDVRWLHLCIIYQMVYYNSLKNINTQSICSQLLPESQNKFELFENYILFALSDLIVLALKKFQQTPVSNLLHKTPFACTCIREFWILLQLCTDNLHTKGRCQPFWEYVNRICGMVLNDTSIENDRIDCSELSLRKNYTCSNKPAFVLWLLKHLSILYTYKHTNIQEITSNYSLLEYVLKTIVSAEVSEADLRIYLILVEKTLNSSWEMKTEPIILFWEYFHKRLNFPFYLPGASVASMAVISKNALGLLAQTNARLSPGKLESNMDSFNLFLRLLGLMLQKWQDNPRFWNQLKGRVFSKFSSSKMATLSEIGLHHFVSLFLTLAVTADLEEVCSKFQSFMKLLSLENLEKPKLELVMKSHMAFVILHAERNLDISVISSTALDIVDSASLQQDSSYLIQIFVESFHDLIDCTNNVELGQYMYIGPWISHFLSNCSESDSSRLLEAILLLTNKLKQASECCILNDDSQLILLHEALWEHVVPSLKRTSNNCSNIYQIADIAASLTTLALSSTSRLTMKQHALELFDFIITSDTTNVTFLCKYLSEVCNNVDLDRCLTNHSISLIKGWLRCCILLIDSEINDQELLKLTIRVTRLPEIRLSLAEQKMDITTNTNYLQNFLKALSAKYFTLQDLQAKMKFRNEVCCYFSNLEKWVQYSVKVPKSSESILQMYKNTAIIICEIPFLIYVKSKANTILQCLLDILLLPMQIRNSEHKLHPYVTNAIWCTLDGFINGLIKLGPSNDFYVARCIRELITIYVPRMVAQKGSIQVSYSSQFSLLRCFKDNEENEHTSPNKLILDTLCDAFIKRRAKIPHQHANKALMFILDIVRYHRHSSCIIGYVIRISMDRICDILMYCEGDNACKKIAKELLNIILDMNLVHSDLNLRADLLAVFSKLCFEHLAFSARLIFDLFQDMVKIAPQLVAEFLPQLTDKVKEVESKRGVGFDRSLRKGIEQIETALNTRKNPNIKQS